VDGGYRISTLTRLISSMRGASYRAQPLTLYPAPRGKKEVLELLEKVAKEITAQVHRWRAAEG